jgi:hypothetical protein
MQKQAAMLERFLEVGEEDNEAWDVKRGGEELGKGE